MDQLSVIRLGAALGLMGHLTRPTLAELGPEGTSTRQRQPSYLVATGVAIVLPRPAIEN